MNRAYRGTLVVTGCALALNALAVFAQGRYLGSEARGIIAAIYNLPTLAFIVGSFGLTNAAGYFAGKNRENAGGVVTTLSLILAIWSIPFTFAIYLLLPFLLKSQTHHTEQLAAFFLLSIPLQFLNNVPIAALQGLGRMAVWNCLRLLAPLILFLVTLLAFNLPGDKLYNLVHIHLLTIALLTVITWSIVFVSFPKPFKSAVSQLPEMLRYGIPSGLTALPAQLNLRVDQVVMAVVVPASVLGVYSLSVAWAQLVVPVFAAMGQVLFPRLVAEELRSEQHRSIFESVQAAFGMGIILSLCLALLSYWALPLLFGEVFRANFSTVIILIAANLFAGMNQLLGDAFRGMGETKPPMWAEGSGFCATMILLVPLVHAFGAFGAAIVSLIAYSATTIVLLLSFVTHHKVNLSDLIRPRLPHGWYKKVRSGEGSV